MSDHQELNFEEFGGAEATPDNVVPFPGGSSDPLDAIDEAMDAEGKRPEETFTIGRSHFFVNVGGVWVAIMDDEGVLGPRRKVASEIRVVAKGRADDGRNWVRLLHVTDPEGRIHQVPIECSKFSSPTGVNEIKAAILSCGGYIESGMDAKTASLQQYLQLFPVSRTLLTVTGPGWASTEPGGRLYVFADGSFYQSEGARVEALLTASPSKYPVTAGTLASWQRHIGSMAVGNSRLILTICAALGGPLLRLVGHGSVGMNLFSKSSAGKTTILYAGYSAFRPGTKRHTLRWNTTQVGAEEAAAASTDGMLAIDDLSTVPNGNGKLVEGAIYVFEGGKSKTRSGTWTRVHGGDQEWDTVWTTTSEAPLDVVLKSLGVNITKGGVDVRCVDIPADGGCGMGVFEDIHGFAAPNLFANALQSHAATNYGWPVLEMVKRLTDTPSETLVRIVFRMESDLRTRVVGKQKAAGQVDRVIEHLAVLAAAGEIASKWGITGWSKGVAFNGIRKCLEAWIEHRGGLDARESTNALRSVALLIQKRSRSGFVHMNCPACWGTGKLRHRDNEDGDSVPVTPEMTELDAEFCGTDKMWICPTCDGDGVPRASGHSTTYGWVSHSKVGSLYYIPSDMFNEEFCGGQDPKVVKQTLLDADVLDVNRDSTQSRFTKKARLAHHPLDGKGYHVARPYITIKGWELSKSGERDADGVGVEGAVDEIPDPLED